MADYGFSQEFLQSGDLRIFLAMTPGDEKKRALFDRESAKDGLITSLPDKPNILAYDQVALAARAEFLERLLKTPLFQNLAGSPAGLSGMYGRQTCLMIGSAPTLDPEFVLASQVHVPVLAVGNAAQAIHPDLWLGWQSPSSYVALPFDSIKTMAFCPSHVRTEQLWNTEKQTFFNRAPVDCPNVFYFDAMRILHSQFVEQPDVTDFHTGSSFFAALTLATVLGFSNIVLHGFAFGGEIDNYWIFDEVPHAEVLARKKLAYETVLSIFPEVNQELLKICVRVSCTEDLGLGVPVLPKDYLVDSFERTQGLTMNQSTAGLSAPQTQKEKVVQTQHRLRQVQVTPELLYANLEDLAQHLPVFAGPVAQKVQADLDAADAKKGGCQGCGRRRVLAPLLGLFQSEYKKDAGKTEDAWRQILPDNYTLQMGSKMVIRTDKREGV